MLWPYILDLGVEIRFAHQTFAWKNRARGNAGVHVVVIGLACTTSVSKNTKRLFFEETGELREKRVENISPYLLEGSNQCVTSRTKPLCSVPKIVDGNNYTKSQALLLNSSEREELIKACPEADRWVRQLMGAEEFMSGQMRSCLWLEGEDPEEFMKCSEIADRVRRVKAERLASRKKETRERASLVPHLFPEIRQPRDGNYLLIPRVTSERRPYVPVGYFSAEVVTTNKVMMILHADHFVFAVMSAEIHMDWLRLVGGRLESRYGYSAGLVYNTFPWPNPTDAQRTEIETCAQDLLDIRERYFNWTMSEMYDPDKMPEDLLAAHKALDAEVEQAYRKRPFRDQAERQQFLLERYQALVSREAQDA